MQLRQLRITLLLSCVALTFLALALLGWGWGWPVTFPPVASQASNRNAEPVVKDDSATKLPTAEQLSQVASRALRAPLVAPPPSPVKPERTERPPPLNMKLLGTIIEEGRSLAMLQLQPGEVELKGIGETIATLSSPVEVLEIETTRVVVRYNGETITLHLPLEQPFPVGVP